MVDLRHDVNCRLNRSCICNSFGCRAWWTAGRTSARRTGPTSRASSTRAAPSSGPPAARTSGEEGASTNFRRRIHSTSGDFSFFQAEGGSSAGGPEPGGEADHQPGGDRGRRLAHRRRPLPAGVGLAPRGARRTGAHHAGTGEPFYICSAPSSIFLSSSCDCTWTVRNKKAV